MADEAGLLLGCIADDFTGATDLANTLVRRGMRTIQAIGVPSRDEELANAEAIVIALKSRTAPKDWAVAQSIDACRWLRARGARQIFFKYCSTFDSTPAGNIGPVADALLAELGADFATVCPAFPQAARTVYQGHLFVGDVLLSDSPMRHHPLTPMTDSNVLRLLQQQTAASVRLLPWKTVRRGAAAMREAIDGLRGDGVTYAVVDALENADLLALGKAVSHLALTTGGSGAAIGLPENFRRAGLLPTRARAETLPRVGGAAAVLSGSCSAATLRQVEAMHAVFPAHKLDPLALSLDWDAAIGRIMEWALPKLQDTPVLVYASAPPQEVKTVRASLGDRAAQLIETAMAQLAKSFFAAGVRRFAVAGGETAGAVVSALAVTALRIGRQIDPGVPATVSTGEPAIAFALKSGNFGSDHFFQKALAQLK